MTAICTARAEVASLMYHEVANDPTRTGFQRPGAREYTLTRRVFADHLDAIAAGPLKPALVSDVDMMAAAPRLLLTFDDGGCSALQVADELARRGWRAHFYIVTSRIGERTFLDAAGIRQLARGGHLVGTHSHTHPDIFRNLTRARMIEEWHTSRDRLQHITGEECRSGSVPGGDISPLVLETAAESGLRFLFTSEAWLKPQDVKGCWVLGRYIVKSTMTVEMLRSLVRLRGWRRVKLERSMKDIARRALGPAYRAYVKHRTAEG